MRKKSIAVVVPVRLTSERFPNKLLSKYKNDTIIGHVLDKVYTAKKDLLLNENIKSVDIFLATNEYNQKLKEYTNKYNINYFYSERKVHCGSERIRLVYDAHPKYDYYISVPADEPEINPYEFSSMVVKTILRREKNTLYTVYCDFYNEEDLLDKRSCKIVTLKENIVSYTSRSVIPGKKQNEIHELSVYKKHIGIFILPRHLLKKYNVSIWYQLDLNPELNAVREGLEQNMFIGRDFEFRATKIKHIGFGIDTPEQVEQLEERMKK